MVYTSPPPAAEPLLKEKPFGKCVSQQSPIATPDFRIQPSPPVARRCNRRGRAQHGHRGNIQGDGWRLRRSGHAEFSLPRVHAAMSPFGLTQLTFTSQTGSLFLSLYAPRYCLSASAGFGRQFTKLRALSRLRRRYDSRKKRFLCFPSSLPSPAIARRRILWYTISWSAWRRRARRLLLWV